jgi:SAM-dependent methyltransferase
VVAVEPSAGMRVQAVCAHPHPRVAWVAGQAERLPLRDASCALAWVSTVVHHLDDLDAAAAELGRVLRPGGTVLVRQAFPGRMDQVTLYTRFFPAAGAFLAAGGGLPGVERVAAAFAAVGFRVETLQQVAQVSAPSLAAYRDKVRRRADTGLRLLPDDQFAAGLAALDRAVEAETVPAPVVDRLDLLVLRRAAG